MRVERGAVQQRDAPDEVRDGQTARPSSGASRFAGH